MYNRLDRYITKLQILNPNQYGFHLAINDMCNNITKSLDRKAVIGIFIDLSNAFDTINHNILLDRLNCLGIHGIALRWFKR